MNPHLCRWSAICLLTLSLVGIHTRALACPPGQYEQCVFGAACMCLPEIGGTVGDAAEHLKKETLAQTAGPVLEAWIVGSRNTAIGTSEAMPPAMRQALTGYIDDDAMNRVRFKVGDNGILNLAGLSIDYGDRVFGRGVAAVTLIDLIVFANANDAYNNPSLWAHELTHVKQFRDWGTNNFAISYVRNVGSVEDPAYAAGNGYDGWRANQATMQGAFSPPQPLAFPSWQGAGFPPGWGMLPCACWGSQPALFAPEPRCQSQTVRVNPCPGMCPGGGIPYAYLCQ
jgi:hypothetical protein